ncbi:MAG: c-type cytochrome [Magnetococcales bacterium]|nr:c-type cytochrome [Magnetococcales bacterium]MBF0114010.1 c-type cytochrome [Magnetococcales bacterium]
MRQNKLYRHVFVVALSSGLFLSAAATCAAEEISAMAQGGRLYDKWYEVIDASPPTTMHPAYPSSGGYADKPKDTWRCKECHGWDYLGKTGAYATGKHATGIVGINRLWQGDGTEVVNILKNEQHQYGDKMSDAQLQQLALFVTRGQVDMEQWIDRSSKQAKGNRDKGEAYFNTICANCHGKDGRAEPKMPPLGKVAADNPWETLHKILNGEPDSKMPALRALDTQISVDILRYAATLPQEK